MRPYALLALLWIIEAAWVITYTRRNRMWRRVIEEAEAKAGGPVALDPRTLMAIHDVGQLNRDEAWSNLFLLYHLPLSIPARLLAGRFYPFHPRGWVLFGLISAGTAVVYSGLAAWLFLPGASTMK